MTQSEEENKAPETTPKETQNEQKENKDKQLMKLGN